MPGRGEWGPWDDEGDIEQWLLEPWMVIEVPYHVQSMNHWRGAHWSAIANDRKDSEVLVKAVVGFLPPHPKRKRWMRITSYRPQLMRDHANLVGGCKMLVDSLVACHLAYDDDDRWFQARYEQVRETKGRRTRVEIW